jgi:tetratricopeptide (TPR) repeat protein
LAKLSVEQALAKAKSHIKKGEVAEAQTLYATILKAFPNNKKAQQGLTALGGGQRSATEQGPPQGVIDQLINLYHQGKLEVVVEQAQNLAAQYSDSAVLWNLTGTSAAQIGQLDLAIIAFQRVLDIKPNTPEACSNMGNVFADQGRLEEAIEAYKKALALKPDYAEAYNNMGNALKDQGKLEEAIEACKKAISITPDNPDAYNNMGLALTEQDKVEEAMAAYNKAVAIQPGYAIGYINIGNALKRQGKLDEAIEAYRNALAIKSDFYLAYNNIGNALKRQGNLEEAIEAYKKALALKPDYAEAYNNMGNAMQDQGKLEEAIEAYNQALAFKLDFADAAWNLSGTAKNITEAKGWIEYCLKANQDHLKAKLILSAIQFYEGDHTKFNALLQSSMKDHHYVRSFAWAFDLPKLPDLYFHRWALFDRMVELSRKERPFYEYGVWRGEAFQHLIKTLKKGYGFDTFEGIPEDWHDTKSGSYSSGGNIPQIEGGEFIVGKFEDTLPGFFAKPRPMASVINFDADLYSSTICALNFSKPVIDQHTILIFDEFIMNKNWEKDEYKALNEFCFNNNCTYEVIAISFFSKQAAVRLIGI